jgi:YHS domain-containing protein
MQTTRRFALVLGLAAALPLLGDSKADPINKDGSGVAIKGYDPVAYFTQSKPVKGSSAFSYQWMNSTWWFASAADRDEFARNPEKYAPQYGG